MTLSIVRLLVIALAALAGATTAAALDRSVAAGAGMGAGSGVLAMWLEKWAMDVPVDRLVWGSVGGGAGLLLGLAVGAALSGVLAGGGIIAASLPSLLGAYLGAVVALRRREDLRGLAGTRLGSAASPPGLSKLIDTSVVIDGRIADLCATGFVDGTLVVPHFVLRELQQLADSADGLKRNRGRRGFDVLERLQRLPGVSVEITDRDVPGVAEVDRKLIELGRALGVKVVTNDSSLQRMAELHGVAVLNLNQLANALRPAVLPGEALHVLVLREGQESGQGVAYLDDGTMVIVDQGKKHLGQRVDVTVTSVLQTAAGRMIFTRLREDERVGGGHDA